MINLPYIVDVGTHTHITNTHCRTTKEGCEHIFGPSNTRILTNNYTACTKKKISIKHSYNINFLQSIHPHI